MLSYIEQTSKYTLGDFPGSLEVKNPPSNAGDAGSIPGLGTKIPHAIRKAHVPQLRPYAVPKLRPYAVINIRHLCIYIYIYIYIVNLWLKVIIQYIFGKCHTVHDLHSSVSL